MGIFDISKVEQPRGRHKFSPRQLRKLKKNKNKVCLMAVLTIDEQTIEADSAIDIETIKDHYRSPTGDPDQTSSWQYSMENVGPSDALGINNPQKWLAENGLSLYQKFTIVYTVHTYRDYWGEYDEDVDWDIIWRGTPDVQALEEAVARSRFLALLEARCDRPNLPIEYW